MLWVIKAALVNCIILAPTLRSTPWLIASGIQWSFSFMGLSSSVSGRARLPLRPSAGVRREPHPPRYGVAAEI
jgi:hypothetical protein